MKDFNITIQFCIAHLIRDIRFLQTLPDKKTKAYGKRLLNEVKNMFKVIHERDNMIPEDFTIALEQTKKKIITATTTWFNLTGATAQLFKIHPLKFINTDLVIYYRNMAITL